MSLSKKPFIVAHKRRNIQSSIFKSLLGIKKCFIQSIHFNLKRKEAPFYISAKGSYTVEAAFVLPIFLFLVYGLFFMIYTLEIQYGIQRAICISGQTAAAVCKYDQDFSKEKLIVLCDGVMIEKGIPTAGIEGGITGISYEETSVEGNYIDIGVAYNIVFPIKVFGDVYWHMQQHSRHRKWIGWDPREGEGTDAYVYITEYGEVYHTKYNCSYLHPSIMAINRSEIKKRRNESGGKYSACESCRAGKQKTKTVYITEYGDVYHCSIGCSGLKRTIYRVPINEVQDKAACSKCK